MAVVKLKIVVLHCLCSSGPGGGCVGGSCGGIETAQLRAIFGVLDELGNRVLLEVLEESSGSIRVDAYAGHQLEYRVLRLLKERRYLHQTLHHGSIVTNSAGHASG